MLVLVGSLRADSSNRRLAEAATALLPEEVQARVSELPPQLPHYDQDLDTSTPLEVVSAFRDEVAGVDAVIVVTPEFNGSLPSVLKNAVDWASRPRGEAALAGKPAAVLGASASPRGARWAREDAVRVLKVAGAEPIEVTLGVASSLSAFEGQRLVDEQAQGQLAELMGRLVGARVAA